MALKRGDAARRDLESRNLTGDTQAPTERLQKDQKTPTERLQHDYNAPMKEYRVRLPESWWDELKRRAATQGLKPSQLIREIVGDYLRGQR